MDSVTTGGHRACELLLVGGGPGSIGAITGFRKHHGRGGVALVSSEPTLPYTRPMLSKEFLRGDAEIRDLPIEAADFFADVDLRLGTDVVALDVERRIALLSDGSEIRYAKCLLVTGSDPKPLPVPGGDDERVYLLRSLHSAQRLRTAAEAARTAVVLGSGFIGCEAAVSLARRGLAVTLVSQERRPQEARLGDEAGDRIAAWLGEENVRLLMGAEVAAIEDGRRVRLGGDREPVDADIVLSGGGITPRVDLARTAGLRIEDGRVLVDDWMQTSAPHVYAAGDIAFAYNATAGRRLRVEHWGEALHMGEIAGAHASGGEDRWDSVPGFWTQIGDRTLKYVAWGDGFDEARVIDNGSDAFTIWYVQSGTIVGALTYNADPDYARADELIGRKAPAGMIDDGV
ncbi:MAG TPA: FAD-dependent oxidoreductase [Micromonosporaceae bacterium]|jgi:NADPH-dependent 2,4-dienoyl-CoA reductase/sulfur reductase-like enzyme